MKLDKINLFFNFFLCLCLEKPPSKPLLRTQRMASGHWNNDHCIFITMGVLVFRWVDHSILKFNLESWICKKLSVSQLEVVNLIVMFLLGNTNFVGSILLFQSTISRLQLHQICVSFKGYFLNVYFARLLICWTYFMTSWDNATTVTKWNKPNYKIWTKFSTKFWASDNWDLGILASLSIVWFC